MKKLYLIFYVCVLNISTLRAQDNTTINLPLPLIAISDTGNIASIEVISNAADSAFIGILPSTYPNVRTNVVIEQGVQIWLQDYVNEQYGSSYKQDGKKLRWVINDVRIGKDSSDTAVNSFTNLEAEIYLALNDSEYQLQNTFDTLIVSKQLTTDFGLSVANAIALLYKNSASVSWLKGNKRINTKTLSFKTNSTESLEDSNGTPKILTDTVYAYGVFTTFQEFLNNAPSIQHFYATADTITKNVLLYEILSDSSAQLISNAWGVSIGSELYCYRNSQLYAIERKDNSFMLSKYIDYQERKNQAMYWRNRIGEYQGDTNPYNDAHVYRVAIKQNKPNMKIETTHIDMETGNMISD